MSSYFSQEKCVLYHLMIDIKQMVQRQRRRFNTWQKKKSNRIASIIKKLKQADKKRTHAERRAEYVAKLKALPFSTLKQRLIKWHGVSVDQVTAKFGLSPTCYLTGLPINYDDGSTYHLEHVEPRSKGGPSNLDNMRLAHPVANLIKGDKSLEEFIRICCLVADRSRAGQII